jgi:hypothetical protein
MDTTLLAAFLRASHQLSDDIQATIDWADDTEFRLFFRRRKLHDAIACGRHGMPPTRVAEHTSSRDDSSREQDPTVSK